MILHPLRQAVWGHIWKGTVEKRQTNAGSVFLHPLIQVLWADMWKDILEKSQTNAISVILRYILCFHHFKKSHLVWRLQMDKFSWFQVVNSWNGLLTSPKISQELQIIRSGGFQWSEMYWCSPKVTICRAIRVKFVKYVNFLKENSQNVMVQSMVDYIFFPNILCSKIKWWISQWVTQWLTDEITFWPISTPLCLNSEKLKSPKNQTKRAKVS